MKTAPLALLTVAALLVDLALLPAPAQAAHPQPATSVAQDLRMAQDADAFRRTAQGFVAQAMAGNGEATLQMLSQALVLRSGEAGIRRALDSQILPFFRSGQDTGRSVTITRTTDANGQQGFAFYMWLLPRDGGAQRPFTVYVVEEGGRPVVANVVPDRLVEGRHR